MVELFIFHEVSMHEDISEILVTEEEIRAKVAELGEQITHDYHGCRYRPRCGRKIFVCELERDCRRRSGGGRDRLCAA